MPGAVETIIRGGFETGIGGAFQTKMDGGIGTGIHNYDTITPGGHPNSPIYGHRGSSSIGGLPMVTRKRTALKLYELYIELEDIEPLIWRRILVPAAIRLPELHDLLQLVMGWTDSHLHSFQIADRTFSAAPAGELAELEMVNEKKYTLEAILGDSIFEFVYEYDFGDGWRHRIQVQSVATPHTDWFYPLCVAGARAAPPDDVGGVGGYAEFLSAINDPKHEEHDSMLVWIGGAFDPEGFDLNEINRTLRYGRHP